ncbi:MAG: FAD:protein FMN transferase [bacterium]|nr:FAD:protein FMN transferase [bacterium]
MKRARFLPIVVASLLVLAACSRQQKFTAQRFQMATRVEIQILASPRDATRVHTALQDAFAAIDAVEQQLSWFRTNNDLARIRLAPPGTILFLTNWTWQALLLARDLYNKTAGHYDVAAGPLIRAWGFGPGKTNRIPDEAELAAARARSGMDKLILLPHLCAVSTSVAGVDIDLSSLAAGFAVDRAAERLLAHGFSNFLVNGGGEIRVSSTGAKRWRIGIQVPDEHAPDNLYLRDRILALRHGAVSTSGSYRNFHRAGTNVFIHLINPRSGRPLHTSTVSVTTWADSCARADAWSTALFCLPVSQALALVELEPQLECLILEAPTNSLSGYRFSSSSGFRHLTE